VRSYDQYRAKERSNGATRKCCTCRNQKEKKHLIRNILYKRDEPEMFYSQFLGEVEHVLHPSHLVSFNLSVVAPVMEPPIFQPRIAQRRPVSLAHYVPSTSWDVFVENGSDQVVELTVLVMYRRSDGRYVYGPYLQNFHESGDQAQRTIEEMRVRPGTHSMLSAGKAVILRSNEEIRGINRMIPAFAASGNRIPYWSQWLLLIVTATTNRLVSRLTYSVRLTQKVVYCSRQNSKDD